MLQGTVDQKIKRVAIWFYVIASFNSLRRGQPVRTTAVLPDNNQTGLK